MNFKVDFSRRGLMGGAGALGLAGMLDALPAAAARKTPGGARPNVLFILADDMGYADLGCYGRRDYETPRLDALAADGVRLTQGYANSSVCSATRTALVTGRYQYRFRIGLEEPAMDDPRLGLPADTVTMPGLFKKLGYHTSLIGKWHVGAPPRFGPKKNGYSTFYGIYGPGSDYFEYERRGGNLALVDNGTPVDSHNYLTDMLASRAVTEIQSYASAGTPFFMSLHFTAPHWPWEGPNDHARAEALQNIFDKSGGNIAVYAEMVRSLDANVGRVLDALAGSGVADNTIVVFTSDNGGERFSDVWPFIGMKGELLEGGIRVPLIARWPGRIARGGTSEQVMTSMDFLPTLLAATGYRDIPALNLDGQNVLPALLGAQPIDRRLFWRYKVRDQAAVRDGRWKYLKMDGKEYLFDLEADQRERAELQHEHPQKLAELRAYYEAWNKTMLPYPADSYSYDLRDFVVDR